MFAHDPIKEPLNKCQTRFAVILAQARIQLKTIVYWMLVFTSMTRWRLIQSFLNIYRNSPMPVIAAITIGPRCKFRSALPMLLMAVASLLAGCLFEAPVDPTQETLDDNLIGAWRCLPSNPDLEDETATFIVTTARDRVYSVSIEVEGEAPDRYEAHRSRIGDALYLNVRTLATNAPDKPWTLARYSYLLPDVLQVQLVEDDRIKPADLSPAVLRQAIESGRADEFFGDYCVCVRARGKA